MNRKFKLRNGIVVEERPTRDSVQKGGFTDNYIIIGSDISEDPPGNRLVLLLESEGYPSGGAWGPEYDIIEEVKIDT